MKVIQINAWYFTLIDNLIAFLEKENADVVLMQEVSSGLLNHSDIKLPLEEFEKLGYNVSHGKAYTIQDAGDELGIRGIAILTKEKVIDSQVHYVPYLGEHRFYKKEEVMIDARKKINKKIQETLKIYAFERTTPSPILQISISHNGEIYTFLTTHYKASERCSTTYQMYMHSLCIKEIVEKIQGAVFFAGDLNIYADAVSLEPLREVMNHITNNIGNTLNPRKHPGFKGDIPPEGYGVDHIFQRGCEVISWRVRDDVDVSDHLPIECIIK